MRDMALWLSGALAVLAAITHAVLGETRVFAGARIEPPHARTLVRLVWHCSAVAWLGGGALLLAAPSLASDAARWWIVVVMAAVYGCGALANAMATRARHFGWMMLTTVVLLALAGM